MSATNKNLTYYFVGKGVPPSLDPESSDIIRNMVHMDHLVGTLLKERYGNSGRTEPYLAERWNAESHELVWNFYLRPGLTCEDGTKIDAPAFVQSFNRILRLYAKRDELAAFNRLKGWEPFRKSGEPLAGIKAVSDRHLRFEFDRAPDGLPEFLAMSFYGFYCESNFAPNGSWKNPKQLVASGAYRLDPSALTADSITIVRRTDFPLISADAPEKISIKTIDASETNAVACPGSAFYFRQKHGGIHPQGFQLFQGAPIFLTALVLSPYREGPFQDVENRKLFRAAVREVLKSTPHPDVGDAKLYMGGQFYNVDTGLNAGKGESIDLTRAAIPKVSTPIKVLRFTYSSRDQNQFTEQVVLAALNRLGWPYELVDPDFKDPEFIRKRNTNRPYDIRFATVDIGGNAENWVVNMMFCSQIAISFPDPTGRICQLVKEHEGRDGHYSKAEYSRHFEQLVEEDAAVVPLYHTGAYWFVSPDIDFSQVLAPAMVVPRFDLLRFK